MNHVKNQQQNLLKRLTRRSTMMGAFFFLPTIMGGNQIHGMDIVYWGLQSAASSIGLEKVVDGITAASNFTFGTKKEYRHQFNEYVANRQFASLLDLFDKNINQIESEIRTDFPLYSDQKMCMSFSVADCSALLEVEKGCFQSYALAILRLDYVHGCKKLLEEKLNIIESLDRKPVGGILADPVNERTKGHKYQMRDDMIVYLKERLLNLGSKLYEKYRYTRGGGAKDRKLRHDTAANDRFKYWGVYELPPSDSGDMPENIKRILYNENQISMIVGNLIMIYDETIYFLSTTQDQIFNYNELKNFDFYKKQYADFFKSDPQNIPLSNDFIDMYEKFIEQLGSNQSRKNSGQISSPVSISSKNTNRNSYERSSEGTMTYSNSFTPVSSLGTFLTDTTVNIVPSQSLSLEKEEIKQQESPVEQQLAVFANHSGESSKSLETDSNDEYEDEDEFSYESTSEESEKK